MTISSADIEKPGARAAWLAAARRALAGRDAEAALTACTRDGIAIDALHAPAHDHPVRRRPHGQVQVFQRVDDADPETSRALALEPCGGGLTLVLTGAPSAHGWPSLDAGDLAAILSGCRLDIVPLRLELGSFDPAVVTTALTNPAGTAPSVDVGLDPLGLMASLGGTPAPWPAMASRLAGDVARLRTAGFLAPLVRADGRPHHEAGATEAEELAAVVATAVVYLRALTIEGGDLDAARGVIGFTMAADADEFLSLAKFRALRLLWAQVEAHCGLTPQPIALHGETSWRMLTRRDPWTNLLRNTIACTGALVGGADSVTVLPHTAALGAADGLARRLARNMPLVLIEEAGLGRVADPAAGSGALAALTDALGRKAWALFQAIERKGGMAAAIASGWWQARLAASQAARTAALAAGSEHIVGTTIFIDTTVPPGPTGAETMGQTQHESTGPVTAPRFTPKRDAEPFEVVEPSR